MIEPHEARERKLGSITVEDNYIKIFGSSTYNLGVNSIGTIGDLKSRLQLIIDDLPTDSLLEVSQVYLGDGKISYILKEGIMQ